MEGLFNSEKSGKVLGLVRRTGPVIGDDDKGTTIGWVDPPSFCAAISEDDANRAHQALVDGRYDDPVFAWNPARHTEARNPSQCESARRYDLLTDRWYRESPGSLLKNIGAGIINAVVPGSDLGDAGSSTQIVGQLIGSVVSSFVNPGQLAGKIATQAISKLGNMSLVSTLNNAFNFVNKAFSGPIGTIATGYVGSLLLPTPVPQVVTQQLYTTKQPAQITDQALSAAQAAVFGNNAASTKLQVGGVTISQDQPWYKNPWVIGAAVVAVILAVVAFFNPFKKRRK